MDVDIRRKGWPQRAACRWLAYSVLWITAVVVCLFSACHYVLAVGGALLGIALAASLPLTFATLFESAYARKARMDFPLICCPWFGAAVSLIGTLVLLQASGFVVGELSHTTVGSAKELCSRFAGLPRDQLPRTVCIQHAFIKTDWEAGKLRCESDAGGRVECKSAFAAAPIFDDKDLAHAELADEVWAWAIIRGRHVDANYRPDGSLCGYLAGVEDFDFYSGDFRLAVERVIEKQGLTLEQTVVEAQPPKFPFGTAAAGGDTIGGLKKKEVVTPLESRPLLLAADPEEVTAVPRALLVAAFILLCLCPCVGPVPLGFTLAFWCWARHDEYGGRHVAGLDDDFDDDFKNAF